eukprot:COSAG05_NODE_3821_length_1820_cov_1.270773_2_plen_36_part_00
MFGAQVYYASFHCAHRASILRTGSMMSRAAPRLWV